MRAFCGFLLLGLGLILPASAETFRNPRHIAIPTNPAQIATADFNGDGRPDFYYTDAAGLNVILANADGSYGAPVASALGTDITSCRAADFNRDDFADAVCFTSSYSGNPAAAVFIGNGDGTFHPSSTVMIAGYTGALLTSLAFSDINSDGHLDIVFQNNGNGVVFTWLGDGTGQFQKLVSYQLPFPNQSWQRVSVADVTGDGHPDLVFVDEPLALYGVGDGTFTTSNSLGPWTGCHLGDFDKDGHLDLFCSRMAVAGAGYFLGNLLEIHHGNPDGTFTKAPVYSKSYSNADFIKPFAARDLNGDGYLDILGLSNDGLVIFFGKPGMQFSAPVHYAFYNVGGFDQNQGDPSLIADYDQDGNVDLAMPGVNGIYITYGRANGTFDALPVIRSGLTTGYGVVADFNEDGTPDIFTSGTTGLDLSLGKGNGTFAPSVQMQASARPPTYYLGSYATLYEGDFNGDKHKDVIALDSAADGSLLPQLFLGRGDGTFQDPVDLTNTDFPYLYSFQRTLVADMNGDGRDDLVNVTIDMSSGTSVVNLFLTKADGTLDPKTTAFADGSSYAYGTASADFNGDGKADLVIPFDLTIQVLLGHGDGTFDVEPQTLAAPLFAGQPSGGTVAVAAGDFDHDGKADFAVIGLQSKGNPYGSSAVFVYYGKGDGTFSPPVTAAVLDRRYSDLRAVDLNGDGLTDFVLITEGQLDYQGSAISILHGLPGRTFSGETNLIAGEGFATMTVADFTRDGQPDLLFTNGGLADSLVLLTNVGTPALTLTSSANPSGIGQSVTFTATISAPADLSKLPESGTVTFEELPGGDASVPITFSGGGSNGAFKATATYEVADLPVGSTLVTAAFPGDSYLNPASASLTQVVNPPPSYQLNASPTTIEMTVGATTNNSVTVTVGSLYGFSGTVNLTCTVAPVETAAGGRLPTCGFATNPLAVKGSDVSTQLIVATAAATAANRKVLGIGAFGKTGIVLWGGVLLLLMPRRLRHRGLASAIMILGLGGSMLSLTSCAGTVNSSPSTAGPIPPTPPPGKQTGSYTVTVSATSDTTVQAPQPVIVQLKVD